MQSILSDLKKLLFDLNIKFLANPKKLRISKFVESIDVIGKNFKAINHILDI
jgi:hypothetical protein